MEISKEDLLSAAKSTDLNLQQVDSLWDALQTQKHSAPKTASKQEFDSAKVTYYVGAFVALFSLPIFLGQMWDTIGFGGAFAIFSAYAAAFAFFALSTKPDQQTARGVLWTLFVFMIPFMIYCLEHLLGMWPNIFEDASLINQSTATARNTILMGLGTLIAGIAVLKYNPLSLVLFPVSLAIWLIFMDIFTLSSFKNLTDSEFVFKWSSLAAGLTLIGAGLLAQVRQFISPFWLYLIGLLALESALILFLHHTEMHRLIFYFTNLFLLYFALALNSRVFAITVSTILFATFSSLFYFEEHSTITKLAFMIIGTGVVLFGWLAQKRKFLPAFWFYLLGLVAFEVGLSILWNDSELKRFFFALINFFLIFLSLFFESHLFSLFGGVAIFVYLSHLASTIFRGSFFFPFALIGIGAAIFGAGVLYSRYYDKWRQWLKR